VSGETTKATETRTIQVRVGRLLAGAFRSDLARYAEELEVRYSVIERRHPLVIAFRMEATGTPQDLAVFRRRVRKKISWGDVIIELVGGL
jgi:hypothetical protein